MILSYVDLNTDLVECFGELENLCNQIYGPTHGVTNYIEEMKSRDFSGRAIVPKWDYQLNRLKEVRHKRNQLAHSKVSFREPYATVDDIRFVVDFRNSILNQTDPIALHYKHTRLQNSVANKQNHYQQTQYYQPQYPQPVYQKSEYKNQTPQRKSLGCFTAVLIVVAIACVISFLM